MDRLLLVDDDEDILRVNQQYLEKQGFTVDTAASAADALPLLEEWDYACIVLDIRMEGTDGFRFCRYLKERAAAPVLFLTSLSQDECVEQGFLCGGDDYLTKPYRLRELELRIRARIRASRCQKSGVESPAEGFTIDPAGRQAYINGRSLQLTTNEFEILQMLAANPGVPFTQNDIYRRIWGGDGRYNSHSVQTLIVRIRRKITELAPDREYIKTVWGKGYMFCRRVQDREI